MGVNLSQSNNAGFSDRPRESSGTGLRITLTPGDDGQYLEHDLVAPVNRLHLRFTLRRLSLANGTAVLCQGFDDQGQPVLQVGLDDQDTLSIKAEGTTGFTATLRPISLLAWDCIEVGFDPVADTATLWINGVQVSQDASFTGTFAVAKLRLGVPRKQRDAAGEIHLDEWILGDGYLGPVTVPPTSDYADNPARWLVIYNLAEADSQTWAEAYRQARNIPHANLLGLDLPLDETISFAAYAELLDKIETYLDLNGLRSNVLGILLGYRVPGYVNNDALNQRHPIGSLLHTTANDLNIVGNPVSQTSPLARPTAAYLSGIRLTARLDAPTLNEALTLTQRAQAFDQTPLTAADQLYFDPIPRQPTLEVVSDQTMDWFDSLDRQRLRLNTQVSGDPIDEPEADFESINDDAIYWGWATPTPPTNLFAEAAGPRAVCVQLRDLGVDAITLRAATPSHWIDRALAAGYASAIAASQSVSVSSLPKADRFFTALRHGWTIAEAWLVSQSSVRSGMYLVGDPLLTIQLPQAGWDVFGLLARSEDLDPDHPLAALPADANQFLLDTTQTPTEGAAAHYLVRRVDELGRSEANFQTLTMGQKLSQPTSLPPAPAWPSRDQWPIRPRNVTPTALLRLPAPARQLELERLELINDQSQPTIDVAFDSQDVWVRSTVPLTTTFTRYRWRLTAPGGLTRLTPWSKPMRQASPVLTPLITLEP